ncbi:MAG: enoyl-CoA hydratase/isomerase family protein [Pseudomonadota bacterium]|nr:enoyl-CoA hydratase/isomerase family protein [Pseudomonadota bacterium]
MSEVLVEKRGAQRRITLNRPDKRNAINDALLQGVSAALQAAVADPEARVIVLTGAGKAFCAGGDLAPAGGFNFDFSQPRTAYGDLLRLSRDCPLPIIAAINGACVAGGMGLLALADIAVAVDSAKFGLPEVKIGLFPMQVMSLLARLVPPRVVREWALTGELFDAEAARAAGLINHVASAAEFEARVEALCAALAARSPTAIRRGKYALKAVDGMSFDQAIAFAEGQLGLLSLTGDAREGFAAFNEKRSPQFKGD